jgi:predicted ABC-type ATPase
VKNNKKSPNLYIIAGPNGAGKTTFAQEFLPHFADCYEFVNADLIAGGLSPFQPELITIKAGKLMLEQIYALGKRGVDFGFETTLSGRMYVKLIQDLKKRGYQIHLCFLWLPNIKLALDRITERVQKGGHNIPEGVVRRRFGKGIYNLFNIYRPLLDFWILVDNSYSVPDILALEKSGNLSILNEKKFSKIIKGLNST